MTHDLIVDCLPSSIFPTCISVTSGSSLALYQPELQFVLDSQAHSVIIKQGLRYDRRRNGWNRKVIRGN